MWIWLTFNKKNNDHTAAYNFTCKFDNYAKEISTDLPNSDIKYININKHKTLNLMEYFKNFVNLCILEQINAIIFSK